jgi:ABC-type Na+ transport system ATPase subunit NatA
MLVDVIEVAGLRKQYRRLRGGSQVAVDGLDMAVPEGGVFGFLGPNGAGKTTPIRCLLGLVAARARAGCSAPTSAATFPTSLAGSARWWRRPRCSRP